VNVFERAGEEREKAKSNLSSSVDKKRTRHIEEKKRGENRKRNKKSE
jgi:hypothetical protein